MTTAGPTCRNGHPVIGYLYDANGWQTWCDTCGTPLNHEPTPAIRPREVIILFTLVAVALVGATAWVWWLMIA